MSYYSEQDPLLPNDKQAPEIQGCRPQSVKDVTVSDAEHGEVPRNDDIPARIAFNDILIFMIGLCVFLVLGFMFLPDDTFEGWQPGRRTIEQRVKKILTTTPLIGIFHSTKNNI